MGITYLIGAGASAEAIPVVGKGFNDKFTSFCNLMLHYSKAFSIPNKTGDFIKRVKDELPRHYSVDTYARKFCFQNKIEYAAFKVLMSAYFLFEQMGDDIHNLEIADARELNEKFPYNRQKIDPRYDVLYAALLDESTRQLPDNIHFISWNYDVQFELSWMGFLGGNLIHAFRDLKVYPSTLGRTPEDLKKAKFLKLNGTAGLVYDNSNNYAFDVKDVYRKSKIETHLSDIRKILDDRNENRFESMLHFAWENEAEVQQTRERAKQLLGNTNILIIIGYSFPLYNRKIDKEIFSNIRIKKPKVYLQVLEKDTDAIQERFNATANYIASITPRKDLNQFFIPDQLI